MTTEEKIVQALENLQAGQERLEKTVGVLQADVKDIKHTQQEQGAAIKQQGSVISHIATAIKALATKQDVERVEKEVDKIKQKLRPPRAD
jgi:ABC-type sulfate transport system substrate-binding protein